jgi:hypothetical protein
MTVRRKQGILINRFLALAGRDIGTARIKPADLRSMLFAGIILVLLYSALFLGKRGKSVTRRCSLAIPMQRSRAGPVSK